MALPMPRLDPVTRATRRATNGTAYGQSLLTASSTQFPMVVRLFSVEEANSLVDRLEAILARAQGTLDGLRTARDQLIDMRIIWGEKILDPACDDHEEYVRYREEFTRREAELAKVTEEVTGLGCEVKDIELGLVDFAAARGEEVVYLCWRKGEPKVGYWHSQTDGFAGRQPIQSI